jgi:hypothetical protein
MKQFGAIPPDKFIFSSLVAVGEQLSYAIKPK